MNLNTDQAPRPSYVRFERRAKENPIESRAQGKYVADDVDFALITAPGSKDVFFQEVPDWLEQCKRDAEAERIPLTWLRAYEQSYAAWKTGQELPVAGTPIKGWGVLSPAQQEMLLHANVLTVEDLAVLNAEGLARLGMGAMTLRDKARAWLSQLTDRGQITQQMADLKAQNDLLTKNVADLTQQLQIAIKQLEAGATAPPVPFAISAPLGVRSDEEIRAAYQEKFGKAPHPNAKRETLEARLKE